MLIIYKKKKTWAIKGVLLVIKFFSSLQSPYEIQELVYVRKQWNFCKNLNFTPVYASFYAFLKKLFCELHRYYFQICGTLHRCWGKLANGCSGLGSIRGGAGHEVGGREPLLLSVRERHVSPPQPSVSEFNEHPCLWTCCPFIFPLTLQ